MLTAFSQKNYHLNNSTVGYCICIKDSIIMNEADVCMCVYINIHSNL